MSGIPAPTSFHGSALHVQHGKFQNVISGIGNESRANEYSAFTTAIDPVAGTQPDFDEAGDPQPRTQVVHSGNIALFNGNLEVRRSNAQSVDGIGNVDIDGYYFVGGEKMIGPRQSLLVYDAGGAATGSGSNVYLTSATGSSINPANPAGITIADNEIPASSGGNPTDAEFDEALNLVGATINRIIWALQTHGLIA